MFSKFQFLSFTSIHIQVHFSEKDMLKLALYLLLLFSCLHIATMAESGPTPDPAATNFIEASCRATHHPALCVETLSSYAGTIQQSHKKLAQAALAVSLDGAQSTAAFVLNMTKLSGMRPREYQAVKDCIVNMDDTVDQLNKSIRELGQMGRPSGQDFTWHTSNVQTWVSAALTDENTCFDGFAGPSMDGNVKAAIRSKVNYIVQVTSNALALVNRFTARYRAAAGAVP